MTDRPAVLSLAPLPDPQQQTLEAAYAVRAEPSPEVAAVVTDGHRGLSAAEIAALPGLRVVASTSAGMEAIDRSALAARGVALANVGPALAAEVADHAMMLLLAAWRGLPAQHDFVRSGRWAREGHWPLGRSLAGRRLGLLGLGGIGQAVAARAVPFGLEILYHARHPRDLPWTHVPDPVELARQSDILVVAVPGGEATRGLVSPAVLDALGPAGVLVNVARGSVVDEGALIAALAEGRLGAAGLDVFASEPGPDPRLTALPNVVLTPHSASATRETRAAMARMVLDNLAAFFAGRPMPGAV
jgi:lactate dehydrogenase-like 2-hydroxyacid dehydrogenase